MVADALELTWILVDSHVEIAAILELFAESIAMALNQWLQHTSYYATARLRGVLDVDSYSMC
jgi:hypothetical protein